MEDMVRDVFSFYKEKRILITGHTGFKGTWLSRLLCLAGADVTGYALHPPTEPSLFNLTHTRELMKSIEGDIRDLDMLINVFESVQPEIVFHLAAQPIVRTSYKDPVTTYSTNVMGTVNLLEAVRRTSSVRSVVNVTTDKVYLNKEWSWGYREIEELCGHDPYSNSKSCSELVTYSYKKSFFPASSGVAVSTARSGNVIGGGDFAPDRIIPDCVRAALTGTDIIVRNPHSVRPYQHVLECLHGYVLLAERQYGNIDFSAAYNFGPEESDCVTTGKLVQAFCDAWGTLAWKIQGDGGPHEANYLKLDCSKAKHALGWIPHWDINKAIEETVGWAKEYERSADMGEVTDSQIRKYFSLG